MSAEITNAASLPNFEFGANTTSRVVTVTVYDDNTSATVLTADNIFDATIDVKVKEYTITLTERALDIKDDTKSPHLDDLDVHGITLVSGAKDNNADRSANLARYGKDGFANVRSGD